MVELNVLVYTYSLTGKVFLGIKSNGTHDEEKIKEINSYKGSVIYHAGIRRYQVSSSEDENHLVLYFDHGRKILRLKIHDTIMAYEMTIKERKNMFNQLRTLIKEVTQGSNNDQEPDALIEGITEEFAEEWAQKFSDKISEDPNEKLVEIIDEQVDHILVRIEGSNKNIKRLLDLVGEEPIEKICDEISKEVHNIKSYRKMISRLKQYIDDLDEEIAEERKCE